jgi:hypothetical protein
MTCSDYHRNEEWVAGWQHGTAHLFCNAADDPLESTNPSVTCKNREGPNDE